MTEPESQSNGEPLAVCTIVSKNYLAYARVLAESLRQQHADSHFFVLLVDRVDGQFDPRAEPFSLVEIEQLPIPDVARFCFQYNVVELNTAAKPYFLAYLFEKYGLHKLIYLDPDIMVLHDLNALAALLDEHAIVLTPHMLAPLDDERHPNELDILKSGAYNLGFIALSDRPETQQFLSWWQERLYTRCQANFARGLFVDQRWIDLVPGYFNGVHILRDPGYNVAYWNLHERVVTMRDGQPSVNDGPCYFVHFSGYDPTDPQRVSKYQERFTMADVGDAVQLFEKYGDRLFAHGFETTRRWPYAFGSFDNGVRVPDLVRRIYLKLSDEAVRFGDPFVTAGEGSFYHWLKSFQGRRLPPLLQAVHETYPDLMQVFPQLRGRQKWGFLRWMLREGKARCDMDDGLLEDVRSAVDVKERRTAPRVTVRPAAAARPFGVNVSGYFQSEKGVGEAARAMVRALDAAGIPYVLNNVTDTGSVNACNGLPQFSDANPYAVNVVQVAIDQVPAFQRSRPEYFAGRHNVAYWNWELASFPAQWMESFRPFEEVWVPSTFTLSSVAAASPVPVRWLPFALSEPAAQPPFGRERFHLPRHAFVFLFVFDFHSFLARKNPLAVIDVFRRAFDERSDVLLVLKTAHAKDTPEAFAQVQAACRNRGNIRLIEDVLDRSELEGLMMLCDAYVSLHRAEGYGLTLLEAMALGKPVIATNYSANEDFMNAENSLPVRYSLVEIEQDHGPYRRGCVWAEPDLEHAGELMRCLVEDRDLGQRLGAQARQDVLRELNPAHVGGLLHERLVSLMERPLTTETMPLQLLPAQVLDPLQELRDANLRLENSQPTFAGRLLNAAKKIVRHLMPPVLDRQAVYNAMVFDAVARLAQRVEQQQREVAEMTRIAVQQRFRSRQAG
jgi:glycosyltransferase involved in cell wall biosynthesis